VGTEKTDKGYTLPPKPGRKHDDVTELWKTKEHADREIMANRRDIISDFLEKKSMHTERCGNQRRGMSR
jgi:hypothetical protein